MNFPVDLKNSFKIAIAGIGPRGLTVLERIPAHASLSRHIGIELLLVRGYFGSHTATLSN